MAGSVAAAAAVGRGGLRAGGRRALEAFAGIGGRSLAASARSSPPDPGRAVARREAPRAPAAGAGAQWKRVRDRESGGVYWWNEATDQTTPVGVPRPTTEVYDEAGGAGGMPFTSHIGQMVAMGAGVAVAATMVRAVFSAF